MTATEIPALNCELDTRTGWPPELRFLLERYPRELWNGHGNLGEMAGFWLARHGMFRELGGALQSAMADFRAGSLAPKEFQTWFAPQLQFFLSQLNAHHQVEDHHYFPIFRAAEQRLFRGFQVLEQDHGLIHEAIMQSVESANEFLRSLQSQGDARRFAGDRYAGVNDKLLKRLLRHLDDEEDLIVPLILDRGEQTLGVA